ncbi:Wnt inhibitory factor 1 [Varanus komodoensis]|nr:Wnt inhibitory factor 1 [Varanus komodoensis]
MAGKADMARGGRTRDGCSAAALWFFCGAACLGCLPPVRSAQPHEGSLYMWIDAHQARVLIGFEEDILIVSEGKMAPFTHDFRKAQQRMPAIPVNIHSMNFTWQATGRQQHKLLADKVFSIIANDYDSGTKIWKQKKVSQFLWRSGLNRCAAGLVERSPVRICTTGFMILIKFKLGIPATFQNAKAEYFYEFLSLRSLDKGIMADPTVNIPPLGTVPHQASVVQVGFPCLGKQDGVAAFEVTVIIMNSEGNIILQTPQNAIFFKTCQQVPADRIATLLLLNVLEDAEMEGSAMKGMYVNVQMDFMVLTVKKQIAQSPALMEEHAFIQENAFALQDLRGISVKLANAISHVEMEANVLVKINASVQKATKEIFVQSLSVNLAVDYMGPVLNPIHVSVKKAGMEDTAIKVSGTSKSDSLSLQISSITMMT